MVASPCVFQCLLASGFLSFLRRKHSGNQPWPKFLKLMTTHRSLAKRRCFDSWRVSASLGWPASFSSGERVHWNSYAPMSIVPATILVLLAKSFVGRSGAELSPVLIAGEPGWS